MSRITELENELAEIKKVELKTVWDTYLTKIKKFILSIQGRTIIHHTSNGGFILYKILDVEEKYYIDREGFKGQWSPCRWLEIKTSSYLNCSVADDRGNWYKGGINHNGVTTFKTMVYKNRSFPKELEMAKIDFVDASVNDNCCATLNRSVRIGYSEYTEYKNSPDYDRAMDQFLMFTQLAPEGMWEAAKAIADDNFAKTKSFWETYQPLCQGLESLHKNKNLY